MVVYDDEKTWKQHYDDWCNILERLQGDNIQITFRRKIIQGMINDYERGHKRTGND